MHDASIDELRTHNKYIPRDDIMEKLCGREWSQKVVFATSHWDLIHKTDISFKETLFETYWSHMSFLEVPRMIKYEPSDSGASAWNILRPIVRGALDTRKERLKRELGGLGEAFSKLANESRGAGDIRNRLGNIIDEKMSLMEKITSRFGTGDTILTSEGRASYNELIQKGHLLWEEVKKILDIGELERFLNVSFAKDQTK
jgi:hypothetical protein